MKTLKEIRNVDEKFLQGRPSEANWVGKKIIDKQGHHAVVKSEHSQHIIVDGGTKIMKHDVKGFHTNEEVITEVKRKKFLGQFRGRTATGQKANAIDTEPSLKLSNVNPKRKKSKLK